MSIEAIRCAENGRLFEKDRADELANVLAAILAIPKFASGLRVPRANIYAELRHRIRSHVEMTTGDLILYLEPEERR